RRAVGNGRDDLRLAEPRRFADQALYPEAQIREHVVRKVPRQDQDTQPLLADILRFGPCGARRHHDVSPFEEGQVVSEGALFSSLRASWKSSTFSSPIQES